MTRSIPLRSKTISWPQGNLLNFLRRADGSPRFFWESERSETAYAGFGICAEVRAEGAERFSQISQLLRQFSWVKDTSNNQNTPFKRGPIWFGGFSFFEDFDPAVEDPLWDGFTAARFVLPEYLLTRIRGKSWLTVFAVGRVDEDPFTLDEMLWDIPAPETLSAPMRNPDLWQMQELIDKERWEAITSAAIQKIHAGELEKVVLARGRELIGTGSTNPLQVLATLGSQYPNCYRFMLEPEPGNIFFGASPELLLKVNGKRLFTMGLAGSIRRGKTLEDDQKLGFRMMSKQKELEEHRLVVSAIQDNLAGITQELEIQPLQILKLSNIQHLYTPIRARLNGGTDILDILASLHPTPAVGGLPRSVANCLIRASEPVPRGWYASPIGWLSSDGDGEFAVALRSAVANREKVRLYAGAGIVAGSDPKNEWREIDLKLQPIMDALDGN